MHAICQKHTKKIYQMSYLFSFCLLFSIFLNLANKYFSENMLAPECDLQNPTGISLSLHYPLCLLTDLCDSLGIYKYVFISIYHCQKCLQEPLTEPSLRTLGVGGGERT
jgi:hypothetical protein